MNNNVNEKWDKLEAVIDANMDAWKKEYNLTDEQEQALHDVIRGLKVLGVDPSYVPGYQMICPC